MSQSSDRLEKYFTFEGNSYSYIATQYSVAICERKNCQEIVILEFLMK